MEIIYFFLNDLLVFKVYSFRPIQHTHSKEIKLFFQMMHKNNKTILNSGIN